MKAEPPQFLRSVSPLDHLTPAQRDALRPRLEEGYRLRNVEPKWFSLLAERTNWDAAILLDACRYDVFAEVNTLPGRLERRVSPGSCTEDWLAATLDGPLDDVVYVSSSPYVSKWYLDQAGIGQPFGRLEEVWKSGWDDSLHTVPPAAVLGAYARLREAMPGKKFVLHFMQPHHPYIGEARVPGAGWREFFGAMEGAAFRGKTPLEMLADGEVDRPTVLAAYLANLRLVLSAVEESLPVLPPRVVVTADHGEAFGECGIFGHPPSLLLPELIEVPFLTVSRD